MKNLFLSMATFVAILCIPKVNFGQAPNLGSSANFVLFSSVGAIGNTGQSQLTGNVGTNSGSTTGFGNVNGSMHNSDGASAASTLDLIIAYNQLNAAIPTFFLAALIGNGSTLTPGIYKLNSVGILSGNLTLDAQGDPNAVFIIQVQGAFSSTANAKVKLVNGAQSSNVYWKIEGAVSLATATFMKGTIVANNGSIDLSTNDTLEGRALSTTGAVNIDGVLAYLPTPIGSAPLTGPLAPVHGSTNCYAVFSGNGPVTNSGVTTVTGSIGSNLGLTVGFNPLKVIGTIHPIPDGSTATCATDLLVMYNTLNGLPTDIELMFPPLFGNELVLTPHTYLLNAATVLTGNVYLNAKGNADAVFVIKINGAFSTSTHANVVLMNGAQAKNVYWKVDGAVSINNYSELNGTIVCNNGAFDITTGAILHGKAFTTNGALTTAGNTITAYDYVAPSVSIVADNNPSCLGTSVSFTANAANALSPSFTWYKGQTLVGTGSTFVSNTLTNDDTIKANINGSNACNIVANATSNVVIVTVNNPTRSITNLTACNAYLWNGVNYSANGSYDFKTTNAAGCDSTATLNFTVNLPVSKTIDLFNCDSIVQKGKTYYANNTILDTLFSTNGCDSVYLTYNIKIGFQVQVVCSKDYTCNSEIATFTSKVINGGSIIAYQWFKNDVAIPGATLAHYLTTATLTGDMYKLRVRAKAPICIGHDTTYSINYFLRAYNTIVAKLNIAATTTNICIGNNVTFTATPTNGGLVPAYQWKINGTNVGTNSNIYSTNSLSNFDKVTCILTADNKCLVSSTDNSNTLTMNVSAIPVIVSDIVGSKSICAIGDSTLLFNSYNGGVWSSSNESVAIVNQNGTVIAKSSGVTSIGYAVGCSLAHNVTVTVAPVMMQPITGPNVVCQNGTVQLSNNTLGTGVWSIVNYRGTIDMNGLVTASVAGGNVIAVYSVTNNVGCASRAYYNVQVAALPAKPTVNNAVDGPYCIGSNYTLTGTPAGGVWFSNAPTATISTVGLLDVKLVGTISVDYFSAPNAMGCTNSSRFIRTTAACTWMPKANNNLINVSTTKMSIYPNPARGIVTILSSAKTGVMTVTSITGKLVKTQIVTDNQTKVNVIGFKTGIYLVTIISAEEKTTEKLIVE